MTPGELCPLRVGVGEEIENRLYEVVAPSGDAIHVVLLILDRSDEGRIGEIDGLGDAAALGAEELSLRLRWAVDDVVRRAEELPQQPGFVLEKSALQVGGQEAVLNVHPWGQGLFGDLAQNDGLVGGLLGVLGEEHDPSHVEGRVDVVVPAVDVEGVFGQGPGGDFKHHGAQLARGVVVLLDSVDDALSGGEIDGPFAGDGLSDGAALGCVLPLALDREGGSAENVELTLGPGVFVHLAHLGGGGDGVEDAGIGNPSFRVKSYELVAVGGDSDSWVFWFGGYHGCSAVVFWCK